MIEFKTVEDKMICIPKIDIVASNVPEMRDQMLKHLDKKEWNSLVLDCSNVDALDSVGVNLIVGLFKKADSAGKSFVVSNCNEPLTKVLKLFRLDEKFAIES
ncbi:STAS domain-containing protein [bacterium]|nr:STAS domain-containing protein [bacterium]